MEEFCKDELSCILADELFSKARHVSLARLLPHITKTSFEPGHRIYEAGQPAQYLYIVLEGSVQLVSRGGKHIVIGSKKRFGEEGGTDFENYMSDAIAASRLTVLMVPKEKLSILLAESYGLKTYFYRSLVNTFSGEELSSPIPKTANIKPKKTEALEIIGWSCIIILSPLALYLGYRAGLNINAYVFLGIITATVIMWSFRLVDEYVPGIFALLASLCIGIAPPHVILSGFTSDGFFMALSILGLGTVIVSSGLSYRALLFMLRLFPKTQFGLNAGLILIGTFLTPILPTANGRIALLSPLLNDMTETTHLKLKGKAATQLAISTFTGTTLFSGMFLTSKSVNLAVFSMFPQQIQDQFQWLSWLFAATATGAVMFILFFIASAFFYRNQEPTRISGEQINQQLALLGKLKLREWAALSGIVIFILGIITYSLHKIQPPWLGMAILYWLLLFGFLHKQEFKEQIDWPFLFYLASIVGIIAILNSVGLDKLIAKQLIPVGEYMRTNFELFILILSVIILLVRLVMPINATIVLLAAIFIPLSDVAGVNAWVIAFIILVLGEIWIFPYQCSYYLQFQEATGKYGIYDEKSFLRFNMLLSIIKLVALYASIPYWKMLSIL